MADNSFKVKKSLHITPVDPSTLSNPEVGDIVVDSTDSNSLKRYDGVSFESITGGEGLGVPTGVVVTDWESYDLEITGTTSDPTKDATPTADTAYYRRVGDSMEITYSYVANSVGTTGSGTYLFNLPSGYSIDDTKIYSSETGVGNVGTASSYNGVDLYTGFMRTTGASDSSLVMYLGNSATPLSVVSSANLSLNNASRQYSFTVKVPIEGWTSNALLADDLSGKDIVVEGAGNGGTSITANVTDIDFTETRDTTDSFDGTTFTAPSDGDYVFKGQTNFTASGTRVHSEYIDGTIARRISTVTAGTDINFSTTTFLEKGQQWSLRVNVNSTLSNNSDRHHIHIQKLASPLAIFTDAINGIASNYNYITNGQALVDTTGYTVYKNTTVGATPDDFGGTPSGSLTLTRNTTTPLIGNADFKLSKTAANLQGEGVYYEFTAENGHLATKLLLTSTVNTSELDDGDLRVYLVSSSDDFVADFNVISANNPDVLAGLPKITKQFQLDATDTSYRLCFHYASTDIVAKDVFLDEIELGPKSVASGAVVTDWEDINTDAGTFITGTTSDPTYGTVVNNVAKTRRVGSNLELEWDYAQSAIGASGSGIYLINLPSGLKIDTDFKNINTNTSESDDILDMYSSVGTANLNYVDTGGADSLANGILVPYSDTQIKVPVSFIADNNDSDTRYWGVGGYAFGTGNAGISISVRASIPIQGWSSNAKMSEDLGHRDVVVEGAGNSGATITANTENIDFTLVRDTTGSWSTTDNGTDTFTAPETGEYSVSGAISLTASTTGTPEVYVNDVLYKRISSPILSTSQGTFAGVVVLEKGDYLNIRFDGTVTLNSGTEPTVRHHIHIQKLASPQTILETETVAARYTSSNGQSLTDNVQVDLVYENLVADTHGAYDASGIYTVNVSGWYQVNASYEITLGLTDNEFVLIRLLVNGTIVESKLIEGEAATTSTYSPRVSTILYLEKEDELKVIGFQNSGTTTAISTTDYDNTFSIARIK